MAEPLDRLIRSLSRLPGIGRRSAERIALRLAADRDGLIDEVVASLRDLSKKVTLCSSCGAITGTDRNPCRICTDARREEGVLCVVEEPSDVLALEQAGGMRGRYHVLMGRISPMNAQGPWDVRLQALIDRIDKEKYQEVILALNTNVESDATASFICELLKDRKVKVTRLAFGLPVGSGVRYSDPVTLERAIRGRQDV